MLSSFCSFAQKDTINKTDADGKQHGYWIISENNVKTDEGRFEHGVKVGIWKGYYPNGNIKQQLTYKDNKPNGYAKFYYENGKVSEEGIWTENKWVGDYKYYHPNGNPAYEWKYNESGKRTGVQRYYHENGKIMIEGDWKEGKENGVVKEYDNQGTLVAEKSYNDGQLDASTVKIYTPTEKSDTQKVNENKSNQTQEVTPQQNTKIDYFDGNGFHKTYTKDGKTDREGDWKGGRFIDGKKYFYDDSGKLVKTTIYKNGNVVNIIYNN
jgi:antitoxin component YwqK of YwqJK toxin-antitoxin module